MAETPLESGVAGFWVLVAAESIRQTLDTVKDRYPGADARLVFRWSGAFFVRTRRRHSRTESELWESTAG